MKAKYTIYSQPQQVSNLAEYCKGNDGIVRKDLYKARSKAKREAEREGRELEGFEYKGLWVRVK